MTEFETFWYGFGGGVIPELLALYRLRHDFHNSKPAYISSFYFWIMTGVMIAAGGLIAWFYKHSGIDISPFLALHIGASAPVLLGVLTSEKPNLPEGS